MRNIFAFSRLWAKKISTVFYAFRLVVISLVMLIASVEQLITTVRSIAWVVQAG